jgi:hypothetical protein
MIQKVVLNSLETPSTALARHPVDAALEGGQEFVVLITGFGLLGNRPYREATG